MTKVSSLGTQFSVNDQAFASKATVKLNDGVKATIAHRSGSNAVALALEGKQWELQHDLQYKDTHLKVKTRVDDDTTLTIKQHVPGGKWALVPTPVFELSRTGLGGRDGKLVVSYDCLNRVGKAEQTLYAGGDKEHKAQLKLATNAGYAVSVRSKLHRGPLLHSAAAAFSEVGGLHLSAKSKFSDGTKVKTSYSLRSEVLSVAAKHKARGLSASDADATLTLAMDIPLGQRRDPRIILGAKWDL